ncbi:DUF5722 domain-containing protein [Lederbergia citri]|uniref:DUF5722 domain-containing protein n=1 Tax=Lederbergia citri TaxID=2833580 RepID=A0A942TG26_9BACI|nr:DUF5722 domain-containing protein [Lederbergia citri]MBS4197005.1 hypothetical protein [Lederbergia citri]
MNKWSQVALVEENKEGKEFMKRFKLYTLAVALVMLFQLGFAELILAGPYHSDIVESDNYRKGNAIFAGKVINDFNTPEQASEWKAGENTKDVIYATSLAQSPVYEGSGVLEQIPENVKVYEWRTIYRELETPLDLSDYKYFAFAANSWAWQSVDYFLKIKLYSEEDVFESVTKINPNTWNPLFLDISNWEKRDSITKIEFSFVQNFNLEGIGPGAPGYDYWNGRFQIDYIAATNILDLQFSVDGETEGFTANNGKLQTEGGALHYEVTDQNTYLESPRLLQELSVRDTLVVPMKNTTDAKQVKISWITEDDLEWNEEKSKIFDVKSSKDFINYNFNFSNNPKWKGTLAQFRIEPIITNPTGSLIFDKFKLDISLNLEGDYQGEISASEISDVNTLEVSGKVNKSYLEENEDAKLLLYELQTYEKIANIGEMTPIYQQEAKESFTLKVSLKENDHNRLYSKFVVALQNKDGEMSFVDSPHYITNPGKLAQNQYPFPEGKSKKGLQVQMTDDAEELGVSHAAINVSYDSMLYKDNSNPNNTIEYNFEGETYYFKANYIKSLDSSIKSLSDNNNVVSLILILYNVIHPDSPNEHLIHPEAEPGGIVYAMNTANEIGVKYYKAITNFIAERYTRSDEKYGRAVNFIVGNEVDENQTWNNMGPKLVTDYAKEYAQTLRLTNTIVKSNYANGKVYTSLTHNWDKDMPAESKWSYDGRDIVDMLQQFIRSEGDIPWNIAYHPYPENLFDPVFWKDPSADNSFDTNVITFKNLEVLVDYMKQEEYLFDGEMRRIILSEQGFHSLDNSLESQKLQAAAYAYAYYKIKFLDGIDSFILHRHVDSKPEYGLHLGLWTFAEEGTNTPEKQKYIYDVMKYIDTERSLEVTDFAKSIIGIKDWKDVIPSFNPDLLAERNLPTVVGTEIVKKPLQEKKLSDFDKDIGKWERADNANSVEWNTKDPLAGKGSLQVNFSTFAKYWRGADIKLDKPINAKSTPYLNLGLKIPNAPKGRPYTAKVKVYSGENYAEGVYSFEKEDEWNRIALNLKSWKGNDSIDRIKVWIKSTTTNNWGGTFLIDEVSFSENVVPVGGEKNVEINAKMDTENLQIGTKLQVEVVNHDKKDLNGEIAVGSEYVTFDQDALKVIGIKSGQSKTFTLTVTELQLPEGGDVTVAFSYREKVWKHVLEKIEKKTEGLLYNFEKDTEGWLAGANVDAVTSSESFLNGPQTPYFGSAILAAKGAGVSATQWRTVYVEPEKPLDLSGASELFYFINSYGGVPNATYETKITLYSGTESLSETFSMRPDQWNEVRVDIQDWVSKDKINKIEISFRAVGNDIAWGSEFQVDYVGYMK